MVERSHDVGIEASKPTLVTVDDIVADYPLPGFEDRLITTTPFKNDPDAHFAFSDEAADVIAHMPAIDGGTPQGASPVWHRYTEGPTRTQTPTTLRIPLVPQRLQDGVRRVFESPRTRKIAYGAGVATVVAASAVGLIDAHKVLAQGSDHSDEHRGDNSDHNDHTDAVHTDRQHAQPAAANAAVAVRQLSFFGADQQDQDSSPKPDPRPYKVYAPLVGKQFEGFDDPATAVPPTPSPSPSPSPKPDPKADVAFSYVGAQEANNDIQAFRGDKITLELGDRVGNIGPNDAHGVEVSVTLSGGLNFDETNPASDGCELVTDGNPIPPDVSEEVSCVIDDGSLEPNEFHAFDIGVVVDPELSTVPASLRVDAHVSADSPIDPDEFNNDASVAVDVLQEKIYVDGKASHGSPDGRSLYSHVTGEFPYAGSLMDENGKPIDAFIYLDEDGNEMCRFTADGNMVLGNREFRLTDGCTANIVVQDTFSLPNNDTGDGGEYHRFRNFPRPLYYPPAKFDELMTPQGAMTITAQADMLLQHQAGLRIGRGLSYRGNEAYEHQQIEITNTNGQLALVIDEGPRTIRPDDKNSVTVTTQQALGEAADFIAVEVRAAAEGSDHDDVYVTVGSGDYARLLGPFAARKINQPGVAHVARPMFAIPPGENHGEASMTFQRPADLDLAGRPMYDLDTALKNELIDPHTGRQWMILLDQPQPALGSLGVTATNLESWGRPAHKAEVLRGLANQTNGILMDPPIERNAEIAFDMVLPSPLEQAEALADGTGRVPDAVLHPIADIGDNTIVGPECPRSQCVITPDSFNQEAVDALFKQQVATAVDVMYLAFQKGEKPTFRAEFLGFANSYSNPVFWSEQYAGAGAKDEFAFRGRFEQLVRSAITLRNQIAAEKYPDMPMEPTDVRTIVMVPFQDSAEMINQGDFYNVKALGEFLMRNPDIDAVALPFFEYDHGVLGNPDRIKQLKDYLPALAERIRQLRPNDPYIELRFVAGLATSDSPKGQQAANEYYRAIINEARAAYDQTGVQFGMDFWRAPGGGVRGLYRGPQQADGDLDYYPDAITNNIEAALTFDKGDDVVPPGVQAEQLAHPQGSSRGQEHVHMQ